MLRLSNPLKRNHTTKYWSNVRPDLTCFLTINTETGIGDFTSFDNVPGSRTRDRNFCYKVSEILSCPILGTSGWLLFQQISASLWVTTISASSTSVVFVASPSHINNAFSFPRNCYIFRDHTGKVLESLFSFYLRCPSPVLLPKYFRKSITLII